jgi:hypothetical protein
MPPCLATAALTDSAAAFEPACRSSGVGWTSSSGPLASSLPYTDAQLTSTNRPAPERTAARAAAAAPSPVTSTASVGSRRAVSTDTAAVFSTTSGRNDWNSAASSSESRTSASAVRAPPGTSALNPVRRSTASTSHPSPLSRPTSWEPNPPTPRTAARLRCPAPDSTSPASPLRWFPVMTPLYHYSQWYSHRGGSGTRAAPEEVGGARADAG